MSLKDFYPEEIKPSYEGISDVLDIDVDTSLEELSDSLATKESMLDQYATAYNNLTTAYESYERVYTNASEVQNTELIAASLEAIAVSIDYPAELTTEENGRMAFKDVIGILAKRFMEFVGRIISWIKKKLGIYKKIFKKLREDYKELKIGSQGYGYVKDLPAPLKTLVLLTGLFKASSKKDDKVYAFDNFKQYMGATEELVRLIVKTLEESVSKALTEKELKEIYANSADITIDDILRKIREKKGSVVVSGVFVAAYGIMDAAMDATINKKQVRGNRDIVIAIRNGYVITMTTRTASGRRSSFPVPGVINLDTSKANETLSQFRDNEKGYRVELPSTGEALAIIDLAEKELDMYYKDSTKLAKLIKTEYTNSKKAVAAFLESLDNESSGHGTKNNTAGLRTIFNMFNKINMTILGKVMFQRLDMVNATIRVLQGLESAYESNMIKQQNGAGGKSAGTLPAPAV